MNSGGEVKLISDHWTPGVADPQVVWTGIPPSPVGGPLV